MSLNKVENANHVYLMKNTSCELTSLTNSLKQYVIELFFLEKTPRRCLRIQLIVCQNVNKHSGTQRTGHERVLKARSESPFFVGSYNVQLE